MRVQPRFSRAILACILALSLLGLTWPGGALADNGEAVSRTARSNLSELALSPDGNRAYLTWSDFIDANGEGVGEIYFRYRDASGWHPALDQPPVNISVSPAVHSEQPTIAVDSAGGVHIIWGEGRPRILRERYLPPGADPTKDIAWQGPSLITAEPEVQNANATSDQAGGIWLVYTVRSNGAFEIFARHRTAIGWQDPENVSRAGGQGAFVGKVAVDAGGVVSAVWWQGGTIRYASRTGGWSAPEVAADPATQQTGLAVEPSGRIHLVYTASGSGGDLDRRIGYKTKASATAPWSEPTYLSGTGNMLEPRIAWSNSRLAVAWNDRTTRPERIVVAQNLGSGWRDQQAWSSGLRAFSPWIVARADGVAYLSFRNADADEIHFTTYTGVEAPPSPSPSPSPSPTPPPAANPAQPAAPLGGSATYYPQTGHNLGGVFRTYWENNGGLRRFGYPLTEEYTETNPDDGKQYTVQYFERARFESHPENNPPFNVLLGLLGSRLRPLDPPAAPLAGATYFPETGHNLDGIFRAYWQNNGGLAVYGYPRSEAFMEVSPTDGKTYLVQYFERNRFEYHPEFAGTENEVLLGLLGRQQLVDRGWLP